MDLVTENSNKKYFDSSIKFFFVYMSNGTSYFGNQIKPTIYLKDYNQANPYKIEPTPYLEDKIKLFLTYRDEIFLILKSQKSNPNFFKFKLSKPYLL